MHMHPVVRFRCGMRHMQRAGSNGVQLMRWRWDGCAHHSQAHISKVEPCCRSHPLCYFLECTCLMRVGYASKLSFCLTLVLQWWTGT